MLKRRFELKLRDGKYSGTYSNKTGEQVNRLDNVTPASVQRLLRALSQEKHISIDFWIWEDEDGN